MPMSKEDHRKASRKSYLKHRTERLNKNKRIKEENYKVINDIKSRPCADCGNTFPAPCMDFDHVRGLKRFTIAQRMITPLSTLLKEIEKCDIVCSNCHRMRTVSRVLRVYPSNAEAVEATDCKPVLS
jgi:hypothetical protein